MEGKDLDRYVKQIMTCPNQCHALNIVREIFHSGRQYEAKSIARFIEHQTDEVLRGKPERSICSPTENRA